MTSHLMQRIVNGAAALLLAAELAASLAVCCRRLGFCWHVRILVFQIVSLKTILEYFDVELACVE